MAYRSCKVVLLGEANVGKSAIATRFLNDTYEDNRAATIGAAFMAREVKLDAKTSVSVNLWDTAGSERYYAIAPMYYRDSDVAIVCYDLSRTHTSARAVTFANAVRETRNAPLLYVAGCKSDLVSGPLHLPEELREMACDGHIHILSAKENLGVHEMFFQMAEKLVGGERIKEFPVDGDVVNLTSSPERCYPGCQII